MTNDLKRRIYEHKSQVIMGFTKRYNLHKLVWFIQLNNITKTIETEKRMKKWKRQYKINIIEKSNPEWRDLYFELYPNLDFGISLP